MCRRRRSLTESLGAASRRVQHRAAPAEPAWSCRGRAVSRTECDATCDNEATARAVAHEAGVDDVRAGLLPAEKVAVVEALVAEYGTLAMVGDGVNDDPALARAS